MIASVWQNTSIRIKLNVLAAAAGLALLLACGVFLTREIASATERRIVERLRAHLKDRAILLVSHRLAAFPEADLILVLDRGRVVERGTHEELMRSGRVYPAIYRAQLRVERGAP